MSKRSATFRFTNPGGQWLTMVIILAIFALILLALSPQLLPVVMNSPYLNGLIIFVFGIGVLACFWQVWQVQRSVSWINHYQMSSLERMRGSPRLLAPLVVLMKGNRLPSGIATSSATSILDSVATRLDETRDITRYLINLLIFLGLLGTFYGLATTIPAVVDTIRSLNAGDGENVNQFGDLMSGLEKQLGGMGTAFGSSLIGLTGSLVVGLLELFAGHGQNRFYREFEEWLSHFTSVGMAETGIEAAIDPDDDTALAKAFRGLNDSLIALGERLYAQEDNARRIEQLFAQMFDNMQSGENISLDSRQTMRGIEQQLIRLNEDNSIGRDSATGDLRAELISINRTLREMIELRDQ